MSKLRCPRGTPKEIRSIFNRIAKAHPQLTAQDTEIVLLMAQTVMIRDASMGDLDSGLFEVDHTHQGESRRKPAVAVFNQASGLSLKCSQRLGLAPYDRARISRFEGSDTGPSIGDQFAQLVNARVAEANE